MIKISCDRDLPGLEIEGLKCSEGDWRTDEKDYRQALFAYNRHVRLGHPFPGGDENQHMLYVFSGPTRYVPPKINYSSVNCWERLVHPSEK
jgi:hypothetical protein